MIKVNDASFTMGYYAEMLDAYTVGMNSTDIYYYGDYIAGTVADEIIKTELSGQGAKNLGIEVTTEEIDTKLEEYELPNDSIYRDIIRAELLQEKLEEHFSSGLNVTMEQAHVQVMLVESEEVATELIAEIETSGNFTDLTEEFSCKSPNEFIRNGLEFQIPMGALYRDLKFNYARTERLPGTYSPVYHIHDPYTPLHLDCTLAIEPVGLPDSLRDKAIIGQITEEDEIVSAGGEWVDGKVAAKIRDMGR